MTSFNLTTTAGIALGRFRSDEYMEGDGDCCIHAC